MQFTLICDHPIAFDGDDHFETTLRRASGARGEVFVSKRVLEEPAPATKGPNGRQ